MSDKRRLLILGAGVMQVPLIKRAKQMGLHTVVAGSAGDYPGIPLADTLCHVDLSVPEAVLSCARSQNISGVITCGMDLPVPALGLVSESLGLPGLPATSASILSDKKLMKECFLQNSVRTARFSICRSVGDAEAVYKEVKNPIMIKAVDRQGSTGILKVENAAGITSAVKRISELSGKDYFVTEEFLSGEEFGAQAFVKNGNLEFILPHGDFVYHGDAGVPIGHYVPYQIWPEVYSDCKDQLERCIRALKIDTAALNADFILHNGQPYLLEIGARCGATMLAETVSIFYGFDYYEQMIRAALGEEVDFSFRGKQIPNASTTLYSNKNGRLNEIENINLPHEDIVEIQIDKPIGARVRKFQIGIDRIGHVIVKGETLNEALDLLNQTVAGIKLNIS